MNLKVAWLYPDLMSTYGDRGNIIVFKKRCEWRGIGCEVVEINVETQDFISLQNCDFIFMGGAQDRQQKIASEDLRKNTGPMIKKMIEDDTPALFVCAAYQFMGHYYKPAEGEPIAGLGLFDLHTENPGPGHKRLIGNVKAVVKIKGFEGILEGFENHGGRTYLGAGVRPLAKIIKGFGNNGKDKTEGAVYKNAFGSYLHGPILPRNPLFADFLIKLALERKYQKGVQLEKLDLEPVSKPLSYRHPELVSGSFEMLK